MYEPHKLYMKYALRLLLFNFLLFCSRAVGYTQSNSPMEYGVVKNMPSFYEELKSSLSFPMAWDNFNSNRYKKWQRVARAKVLECMSPAPPCAVSFAPEILAEELRHGYRAQKLMFNVNAWCRVPAYLLVPDGEGPFPAVLVLHDHGAHFSIGKEKVVRPFGVPSEVLADAESWSDACYDGEFVGDRLAREGYVVLAVDALFWGDRGRREGPNYEAQQALNANFLQMGMSFGSFIAWDDLRSVEFLCTLPCVKSDEVAVMGHSMGGHRAWMTAALSDKVKAGVAICWMNTTQHLVTLTNNQSKGGSAYSMIIPGLRNYLDYPHVASLACPKPMLFMNGTKDKLFPVQGVEDAYAAMRCVWHAQKADSQLVTRFVDSPHYFGKAMQDEAIMFLNRVFKCE